MRSPPRRSLPLPRSVGLPAQTADSVLAAIRDIPVHDGNGRVLICGSLYFAGKVLAENG